MPSTYAHYRFGQEVLKELPNDIKKIIIEIKNSMILDYMAQISCFIIYH